MKVDHIKEKKAQDNFSLLSPFLQRSSTDQANISSKFETLGGELDEKRKLDLYTGFKIFNVYHFIHKPIITVFNKLMVSAF